MKILNLALAIAAPAMLSVGFVPMDYLPYTPISNVLDYNNLAAPYGSFKLSVQPYYDSLFTKKELKQLAKAEKLRTKCSDGLAERDALDTEAAELERGGDKSSKTIKKIAKLKAKSSSKELAALKTFETAAATFKDIYTQELKNKLTDTLSARAKAANNLAQQAKQLYAQADADKRTLNTDNALQTYRKLYSTLDKAIECQELAFAIIKNDKQVDYTQYVYPATINPNPEPSPQGNVAKEDLPVLRAPQNYDFAADKNIYHFRYNEFKNALKISNADSVTMAKLFYVEKGAAQDMQKAQNRGCKADTMRVYASQAVTITEKEYYEQLAQEEEINECSALVNAINQEIKVNNTLFELYQKYIPKIRKDIPAGKAYEAQAVDLYKVSKSYETSAANNFSKVDKYTTLSAGNEIKLQAIANMENAIATYLGLPTSVDKNLLAEDAPQHDNGNPMTFNPYGDESDEGDKPAKTTTTGKTPKDTTGANTVAVVDKNTTNNPNSKPKTNGNDKPKTTNTDKPKTTNTDKPKTNTTDKPQTNTTTKPTVTSGTGAKEKIPVSNSNAPAISAWFYTKEDQRLKPYTYPSGTIFTVETGIYKEMPEPVDFPAINVFVAEKLKNQNYMRYYLGSYRTYDAALAAQAMAKNGGYKSAVVSAFVNGKKTAVANAKANAEKQSGYSNIVQRELKELSVHQNEFVPPVQNTTPAQNVAQNTGTTDAQPLSTISGTAYAVQISSVPTMLTKSSFNVNQLYYDQNNRGLYRYYTGISTDLNIAKANLQTMKACGYDDAYIIKVSGGKNVGAVSSNNPQPASNRTIYRVQIGAFKSALSKENKAKMDKLKKSYAVHTSQSGEYTVYTVGDCDTRAQADNLRADLVKRGYTESYVVTFINGVKQ